MLHVPFTELMSGGAEQMLAQQRGFGMNECHRVLQLVPETERAAGLVKPRTSPHAAGERLIDKPAVGQEVDVLVRCFEIGHAERPAPVVPDPFQGSVGIGGAAEPLHEMPRLVFVGGGPEKENDVPNLSISERDLDLHCSTGIESRADAAAKPNAA